MFSFLFLIRCAILQILVSCAQTVIVGQPKLQYNLYIARMRNAIEGVEGHTALQIKNFSELSTAWLYALPKYYLVGAHSHIIPMSSSRKIGLFRCCCCCCFKLWQNKRFRMKCMARSEYRCLYQPAAYKHVVRSNLCKWCGEFNWREH